MSILSFIEQIEEKQQKDEKILIYMKRYLEANPILTMQNTIDLFNSQGIPIVLNRDELHIYAYVHNKNKYIVENFLYHLLDINSNLNIMNMIKVQTIPDTYSNTI